MGRGDTSVIPTTSTSSSTSTIDKASREESLVAVVPISGTSEVNVGSMKGKSQSTSKVKSTNVKSKSTSKVKSTNVKSKSTKMARLFKTRASCLERRKYVDRDAFVKEETIAPNDRAVAVNMIRDHLRSKSGAVSMIKSVSRTRSVSSADKERARAYRTLLGLSRKSLSEAVINTFDYMMDHHHRGVYVSIRGGRVAVFMLFVNRKWKNPLAPVMRVDHGSQAEATAAIRAAVGDAMKPVSFSPAVRWTNIGCLVNQVVSNYTPPHVQKEQRDAEGRQTWEVPYHHRELRDYFELLCGARAVPDCDFFLNYLDRLVLRRPEQDGRLVSPYWHLVEPPAGRRWTLRGVRTPLVPIVSMCTREGFLDLPCVTPDDINRVMGTYGPPRCSNPYAESDLYELTWSKKADTAVFRGSDTGCGWTIETNQRMALVALSASLDPRERLIDAALTGPPENLFKKHASERFVRYHVDPRVPRPADGDLDAARLSMPQQSAFKYLIYVEGNVAAYRLAGMFATGSLVLYLVGDGYTLWFHHLLEHMGNCIFVQKVVDLPDVIRWCRKNDGECKRIAESGFQMYKDKLSSPDSLLDHGLELTRTIASACR
jgi:hypothetical protein